MYKETKKLSFIFIDGLKTNILNSSTDKCTKLAKLLQY